MSVRFQWFIKNLNVFFVGLQIVFSLQIQKAIQNLYLQVNKWLICKAFGSGADGTQLWSSTTKN